MSIQKQIMNDLHVKPSIDPKQEIEDRVNFLKQYLKKTGAKGFVLGISGGRIPRLRDASPNWRLKASEKKAETLNLSPSVFRTAHSRMRMTPNWRSNSLNLINHGHLILSPLSARSLISIKDTGDQLSDFNKGNVKARMRMIAQYAIGGQEGLLVIGTDHAAEAVTGFFTKYGDGGADLLPLTGLTKRQGRRLLEELGAPERLYLKLPTADLLDEKPQQTDETELGITYNDIDDYLEGKDVSSEVIEALEKRYLSTEHKRQVPASMFDDWWK